MDKNSISWYVKEIVGEISFESVHWIKTSAFLSVGGHIQSISGPDRTKKVEEGYIRALCLTWDRHLPGLRHRCSCVVLRPLYPDKDLHHPLPPAHLCRSQAFRPGFNYTTSSLDFPTSTLVISRPVFYGLCFSREPSYNLFPETLIFFLRKLPYSVYYF